MQLCFILVHHNIPVKPNKKSIEKETNTTFCMALLKDFCAEAITQLHNYTTTIFMFL